MSYRKLQLRRGLKSALPTLAVGELGYCTDTDELYIGNSSGNKRVGGAITKITIPAGRMRGDINGDGKITCGANDGSDPSTDLGMLYGHIFNTSPLTDATQLLCADVNGDGAVNIVDMQILSEISLGETGAGGYAAEVTGNWTNNPNYDTEEGQFYTDITIAGMTANSSASVIVKGSYESGFFTKAECMAGKIRIYAKLCPIAALTAIVTWGAGDGTAVITAESDITSEKEYTASTTTTWTDATGYYTQSVPVTGLLATDNPIVDLVTTTSGFEAEQAAWGKVFKVTTEANSIILYASEAITTELNLQIKVVR